MWVEVDSYKTSNALIRLQKARISAQVKIQIFLSHCTKRKRSINEIYIEKDDVKAKEKLLQKFGDFHPGLVKVLRYHDIIPSSS